MASVKCPICGDVLETQEDIDAHDHEIPPIIEHAGAGFPCPVCGVEFDSAEHLVEHEATHVS